MMEFFIGLVVGLALPYLIRNREEIIDYLKLRRKTS